MPTTATLELDRPVRDSLYNDPPRAGQPDGGQFRFDSKVAAVFPDMIRRSVPGYPLLLEGIGLLAKRFAQPDTQLYDLGCSLGSCALAMARQVTQRGCRVIAVDNAPDMLEGCRQALRAARSPMLPIELRAGDLRETPIAQASVVVVNLTLQFVPVADRGALLSRIQHGMVAGGALVLAEKTRMAGAGDEALFNDLHADFKRSHGYSEIAIARKREALREVLVAETLDEHTARLRQAGFVEVSQWFQCLGFVALLARKPPAGGTAAGRPAADIP